MLDLLRKTVTQVIFTVYGAIVVFPMVWLGYTSFKTTEELFADAWSLPSLGEAEPLPPHPRGLEPSVRLPWLPRAFQLGVYFPRTTRTVRSTRSACGASRGSGATLTRPRAPIACP